jgi:hypothetical protein
MAPAPHNRPLLLPLAQPAAAQLGPHGVLLGAAVPGGSDSTSSAQPPPATSSDGNRPLDHVALCQAWGLPSDFDPSLLSHERISGATLLDELRSELTLPVSEGCEDDSFAPDSGAAGQSGVGGDSGSGGLGAQAGEGAQCQEELSGSWDELSSMELPGGQGERRQRQAQPAASANAASRSSTLLAALSQEGFAELQLVKRA